jgi:hypothetical protein
MLRVEAAQVSNFSDTLSSSIPGVASDHTLRFTTPNAMYDDGSTVTVTFPGGFDVSSITEDDVDIEDDGVDLTTDTTCGAVNAAVTLASQTLTIEMCNGGGVTIATSSVVVIKVGENATDSGAGANQVVNHVTPESYVLDLGGTMGNTGSTRIVILDDVTVSGSVNGYFIFSVDGVDAGQTVNADANTTFATSTATSVPFGLVQPNTNYVLAQDVAVTTNSESGFTVTVFADGNLQSVTGATINSFNDGTATATPIAWVAPSALYNQPDTYGHWGVTTEDNSLSDNDSFGNALYAGNFITTPREVFYATSSADGTTPNTGLTRVGYKLRISTLQEAAADYSTRLIYVATPVF